jgi:hypothetical protein
MFERRLQLLVGAREDDGSVLIRSAITIRGWVIAAFPIPAGSALNRRLVPRPELAEDCFGRDDLRVVDDLYDLGMSCGSAASLLVCRVFCCAAGIADCGAVHAGERPELGLGTPESTFAQDDGQQALGPGALEWIAAQVVALRDGNWLAVEVDVGGWGGDLHDSSDNRLAASLHRRGERFRTGAAP